jgi:hypothetical protein
MATLHLKQRRKRRRYGPYTKSHGLTTVDGRCRVARVIRELARELEAHLGREPTPAQRVLIRESAVKNAKLGLLVNKILDGTEPDLDMASRCYLAWSNSLRRDLEALGLKAPEQKVPELGQFLALQRAPAKAASDPPKRRGRPPKLVCVASD